MPDYGLTTDSFCDDSVKVAVNFDAKFTGWGLIDPNSITIRKPLKTYELLEQGNAAFNTGLVSPGYKNPVTGQWVDFGDKKLVLRLDTGEAVSVVGNRYNPMPYYEVLDDVFGEITEDGQTPQRLLVFENGARITVLFYLGGQKVSDRQHYTFTVLTTGLTGTEITALGWSDYCAVCQNTYAKTVAQVKESGLKVKRTKNMGEKLSYWGREILRIKESSREYYGKLDKLSVIPADSEAIKGFISHLLPDTAGGEKRQNNRRGNRRESLLMAIGQSTAERNTIDATGYDLFAGVTRMVTYSQPAANDDGTKGRDNLAQWDYVTSGPGATFADNAWDYLMGKYNL